MEKAKVYFSDLRTSPTSNLLDKMERLLKRAGIGQLPLKYCRRTKRDGLQRNTDRRRILPCSQDRYCHCRCGHNHQHEPF